jgi:hypothetical protein
LDKSNERKAKGGGKNNDNINGTIREGSLYRLGVD